MVLGKCNYSSAGLFPEVVALLQTVQIYVILREEKRDAQLRAAQQRVEKEAVEHNY